ncbi:MAG: hypothetical protein K5905_03125 [Roseibium sp.]|uniref:hypothetical protein n=1 Tax=Roseibium sp. TaxID=1936156 RepID=UPI00261B4235|nr:hypothetical protein [Roseibium sp.]MCV0424440.1 hypothetical protein [Roseibium sp.]
MTQDPTLFTAFEWVLLAMVVLICLLLFVVVHRAEAGSPFSERDENWFPDDKSAERQTPEKQ